MRMKQLPALLLSVVKPTVTILCAVTDESAILNLVVMDVRGARIGVYGPPIAACLQ